MKRRTRARDEAGSALIEVVWLSIILMVPLVYVMVSVFQVQSAAFGTTAASRAAGRAFSLADSEEQGEQRARAAAEVTLRDQGVEEFSLEITCSAGRGNCFQPDSVITVEIRTQVRLPLAPDVLGGGAPSFRLDAKHAVPYGRYRTGR